MNTVMPPTVIIFVLIAVLALVSGLYFLLSRRIAVGPLPRPSGMLTGFGVRIPSTLKSDTAWRAAHDAIRPAVLAVAVESAVGALLAIVLLVVGQAMAAFVVSLVAVAVMLVASLAIIVRAHVVASRSA